MNVKETERKKAEDLFKNGLKPKEISSILGVHISTIYSWKKDFDQSYTPLTPKEKHKKENENKKTTTDLENENIELREENKVLKKKIRDLEQIVADLLIKLKVQNDKWLD